MFKTFFTVLILTVLVLSITAIAGVNDFKNAKIVSSEDEAIFEKELNNVSGSFNFPKLPNELGRTWYDYACNNISGRIILEITGWQDLQAVKHFLAQVHDHPGGHPLHAVAADEAGNASYHKQQH